ncbi:hypothetical protein NEOLI_002180 [Neolecta irregularis DAH-3]|uniref:Uncharacterized protein n=1 Tax=Neolecta irregularis (strain DAH-3) TaxID=1198029 RepID=A0A1U7LH76_NEOID|nr:hypothetical protein NEOLI_002180 [Neolecta irregularis DAH-3]|eukprot:OLL21902.1 hypothetical protein NEOLI_002180 [Neolecta irregularis DAH-3]
MLLLIIAALPATLSTFVAPGYPLFDSFVCKDDTLVATFAKHQQDGFSLKKVMHCPSETGQQCSNGACLSTRNLVVPPNFQSHRETFYHKPSGHYLNPTISLSDFYKSTGNDQCLFNYPKDPNPVQGIVSCNDQHAQRGCELLEICPEKTPKCVRFAFEKMSSSSGVLHTDRLQRVTYAFCVSQKTAENLGNLSSLPEYHEVPKKTSADLEDDFGFTCNHDKCAFM